MQQGCDFWYQVNDPAGLIPPLLRLGRRNFNDIEIYGDAYVPQSLDLVLESTSITGTGQTYSSGLTNYCTGTFTGKFLGFPFAVTYSIRATFTK